MKCQQTYLQINYSVKVSYKKCDNVMLLQKIPNAKEQIE